MVLSAMGVGLLTSLGQDQTKLEDETKDLHSEEGVQALNIAGEASEETYADLQPVGIMADGNFAPARLPVKQAKVLIVDDDRERRISSPFGEVLIESALNDGGYSYDVFRSGRWANVDYNFPSGDTGLAIMDDYEAVIWWNAYAGRDHGIVTSAEISVLEDYLDGQCVAGEDQSGTSSSTYCTDNRNLIVMAMQTQAWPAAFKSSYMHAESASTWVYEGTANPMDGVDDSIMDGKSFTTNGAGTWFLQAPVPLRPYDSSAMGMLWMDPGHATHKFHAIQYPETESGIPHSTTYKSILFGETITTFDKREDRADIFATMLEWMGVDPVTQKQVDIGISNLEIPMNSIYWRHVEAMSPVEIRVHVTNYGYQTLNQVGVYLKIKNEFGQVLFENTLWSNTPFEDDDTTPENEGSPGNLLPDETWVATFNLENDRLQRIDDGTDPRDARHVLFTTAGMDRVVIQTLYYGGDKSGANADQYGPNDYMQGLVGVAKWTESAEGPDFEVGKTITIVDTDTNGASSLGHYNAHRATSYDFDMNPSTANETGRGIVQQGEASFAYFKKDGWKKSNGDRVFTPQPNQDDAIMGPEIDLSGMEEVVMRIIFSGYTESGDQWRIQIKKVTDSTWSNLISSTPAYGKGMWYLWAGSNAKYQGYVIGSSWYGSEDSVVQFRFLYDGDSDQNTDNNGRPYLGPLWDQVAIVGTERVTKDLAVTDASVRADNFKRFSISDDKDRELNATVVNVGESSWTEQPVDLTVTNLQGQVVPGYPVTMTIPGTLEGGAKYGDIELEDHEDEKELFHKFTAPEANTYFAEFNARVSENRDQFPWNNSLVVEFRVFNSFFFDNAEDSSLDLTDNEIDWNTDDTRWFQVKPSDFNRGFAHSGQKAYYLTRTPEGDEYEAGTDSGMATPDEFDRDGDNTEYDTAPAIDLRAAYKPELEFWYQYDLGINDKLLIQASDTFQSGTTPNEADWTTLHEFEGTTPGWGSSWEWQSIALDLSDYSGNLVWIQFRVTADEGPQVGEGVLIDDIAVIGSEFRNNVDIWGVDTEQFGAAATAHPLAVTVKNIGVVSQSSVRVEAQIVDPSLAEGDNKLWPAGSEWLTTDIPVELETGDTYTIDGTEGRWSDWVWGEEFDPGIYTLRLVTHLRNDPEDLLDEDPAGNYMELSMVLGASLLGPTQWTGGAGWDTAKTAQGEYQWTGGGNGKLESDQFTVWNDKPFLVMDASYELDISEIIGQVRVKPAGGGSWAGPFNIHLRDSDLRFFHAIPGKEYSSPPDSWTGSSDHEGKARHTFWADLGRVTQISDISGTRLDEKYIGGTMQIFLQAYKDGRASEDDAWATFYNPSVFGMQSLGVEVQSINPGVMEGYPSPVTGSPEMVSYNVKARNLGASKDFVQLDVKVVFPNGSAFLFEDDNANTILHMDEPSQGWRSPGPDGIYDTNPGSDDVIWGYGPAWVNEGGSITYLGEDGLPGTGDETYRQLAGGLGWEIVNPTKGRTIDDAEKFKPGEVRTIGLEIQMGFASQFGGTVPGDYIVEVTGRSYADPENVIGETVTATLSVAKPDLTIGAHAYTTHVLISSLRTPQLFFQMEILNLGTETSEPFVVDILSSSFSGKGLSIFVMWDSSAQTWKVQDDEGDWVSEVENGPSFKVVEGKTFLTFSVEATELGVVVDPGADKTDYVFYLSVDPLNSIPEQDESNNEKYITITAVRESITTPSFNLGLALTGLSGLLAALGVAFSRREEEEDEV